MEKDKKDEIIHYRPRSGSIPQRKRSSLTELTLDRSFIASTADSAVTKEKMTEEIEAILAIARSTDEICFKAGGTTRGIDGLYV